MVTIPKTGAGCLVLGAGCVLAWLAPLVTAQRGRENNPFPGGTNPDGSLRPTPPVSRLFTQDAYTEYALLAPGSEAFRIRFLPEETRVGATELVNATRGGSEGSGIEVYDPRTGKPLKFTYQQEGNDPDNHAIHAALPSPVPEGGVGRVLIYKTYKDPRTYMMHGDDIVWVRSLSGYRLGVLLPKGFAFISSNVAAQLTTTADGRLKLAFANPSGQSNPVTIHARRTSATFAPRADSDMFFDDIKTLYDLDAPDTGRIRVEQVYSDYRKGDKARLDSLTYLPLQDVKVVDLDTAKPLPATKEGGATVVKLEVPIVDDRQSAHIKITGTVKDGSYKTANGELVFERTLHGLRNTVVVPPGWDVSAVSQSATIGTYQGRSFVALINLNSENNYRVSIRARRSNAGPATAQPARGGQTLFRPERLHDVDPGRARRGQQRRDHGRAEQHDGRGQHRDDTRQLHVLNETPDDPRQRKTAQRAGDHADRRHDSAFGEHGGEDRPRLRADGHPDAELARAAADREREDAGDADDSDRERNAGEAAEDNRIQPIRGEHLGPNVLERARVLNGLIGSQLANRLRQ
jgi:hypothetical protein